MIKNPPVNAGDIRGVGVRSLGQKDPLEKEMATLSSILAWRIPWTKETGGLQSMGSKELDTTEQLTFSLSLCFILSPQSNRDTGTHMAG